MLLSFVHSPFSRRLHPLAKLWKLCFPLPSSLIHSITPKDISLSGVIPRCSNAILALQTIILANSLLKFFLTISVATMSPATLYRMASLPMSSGHTTLACSLHAVVVSIGVTMENLFHPLLSSYLLECLIKWP